MCTAPPPANGVVHAGEVGDTWIFGVQSDPLKTANFRAASRARAACIADAACPSDTPAFTNFTRLLLKVPEVRGGVWPLHWHCTPRITRAVLLAHPLQLR